MTKRRTWADLLISTLTALQGAKTTQNAEQIDFSTPS